MATDTNQRASRVCKEDINCTWIICSAEDFVNGYVPDNNISMHNFIRCYSGNWIMDVELKLVGSSNQNQSFASVQRRCTTHPNQFFMSQQPSGAPCISVNISFRQLHKDKPFICPHSVGAKLKAFDEINDSVEYIKVERDSSSAKENIYRNVKDLVRLDHLNQNRGKWIVNNRMQIDFKIIQCWVENYYDANSLSMALEGTAKTVQHLNTVPFWETKEFADCRIAILDDGKTVSAHKIILAATSPVIAALLKQETKDVIQIKGFRYEVVEEFLHFLYMGKTRNADKMASELLSIAAKYEVKELFKRCEQILCSQLNVSNSVDTLQVANDHQATQVKEAAKNYIISHFQNVLGTPAWSQLLLGNVQLATEVLKLLGVSP